MSAGLFDKIDRAAIEAAVWGATQPAPRSDFDLAPDARALLPPTRKLRPAAVLCPIVERPSGFHVILTRRADHLSKHPGQIAFPGGKVDAFDPSPLATALREAEEEIGLGRDHVDVLGAIDLYETSTSFSVTPFVGLVDPRFQPILDDNEVAEVFETPLSFLMDPANHQRHSREWMGRRREFYAMPWAEPHGPERYIWGATAGMLRNLSDRMRMVAAARDKARESGAVASPVRSAGRNRL